MTFTVPTRTEKAKYVQDQFNRIAIGYDRCNDLVSLGMHRLWKHQAIKALNIKPTGNYLDVCCGTGDLTFLIAKSLTESGCVTGLDFSSKMLDIASSRSADFFAKHKRAGSIALVNGDALNLPFADHSFDGAIISFGLRNLTDFNSGIKEISRVLKPQARLVNLDLGHPKPGLFGHVYNFYFNNIVPLIGETFQKERTAYTYLPKSLNQYPNAQGISTIFTNAHLTNVEYRNLAFGTVALHWGTAP